MVPVSHLIVNYVQSEGELVADSLDIEISHILQNFVRFASCVSANH